MCYTLRLLQQTLLQCVAMLLFQTQWPNWKETDSISTGTE